jgi:FkbM family methyltransferase
LGNVILRINQDGALGPRGSRIMLAEDKVIYFQITHFASWETETSAFLAAGLIKISGETKSRNLFLDLGGNAGLITLQTMNLARTGNEIIIVEPMARHIEAIRFNLSEIASTNKITISEFGLGERSERIEILRDSDNWGNVSLMESAMAGSPHERYQIEVRESSEFFNSNLTQFDRIVLKSDMQGFDAKVLARMSAAHWAKVERAAIEVWALADIDEADVDHLMELWKEFDIDHREVANFWKSKSGEFRDLWLVRSKN